MNVHNVNGFTGASAADRFSNSFLELNGLVDLVVELGGSDVGAGDPSAPNTRLQEKQNGAGPPRRGRDSERPRVYRSPYYFERRAALSAPATSSPDVAPAAVFTSPEERPTCVSLAETFSGTFVGAELLESSRM